MIKRAPEVVLVAKLVMMDGVQAMIRVMLADQMEQTRQLLQGNRREVTAPMDEPMLNEGQSKEGSYSRTVDQVEP